MNIGLNYKRIVNIENEKATTHLSTGLELIKSELELLLNMPKYSLFFGNNMGLDLEKYLYLRNREAVYHLIRDDITEVLNKYNKVNLKELRILFKDSEINIILEVEVKSTLERLTLPITLYT